MIHTASFFHPKNHVGELCSIAHSEPGGVTIDRKFESLVPTPELLAEYKSGKVDWDEYAIGYTNIFRSRWGITALPRFLEKVTGEDRHITLLCWEHKPERCHRRLAGELIAKYMGTEVIIK